MILQPITSVVKHAIIPSVIQSIGTFTAVTTTATTTASSQSVVPITAAATKLLRGGGKTLIDFDRALFSHIGHIISNGARAFILSLTGGRIAT